MQVHDEHPLIIALSRLVSILSEIQETPDPKLSCLLSQKIQHTSGQSFSSFQDHLTQREMDRSQRGF